MNRNQLVDAVAASVGDRRTAAAAVQAVLDTITRTVAAGERVALTGFGVFDKADRAARAARNPSTGATVQVAATSVPRFRAGTGFRDVVGGRRPAAEAAAQPAGEAAVSTPVRSTKAAGTATAKPSQDEKPATAAKAGAKPAKAGKPAKDGKAGGKPAKDGKAAKDERAGGKPAKAGKSDGRAGGKPARAGKSDGKAGGKPAKAGKPAKDGKAGQKPAQDSKAGGKPARAGKSGGKPAKAG